MTRRSGLAVMLLLASLVRGQPARAALVEIRAVPGVTPYGPARRVTAAESSAAVSPAPAGGGVFQFAVTTDGDILSVNQVLITLTSGASLFQHQFGDPNNANPPRSGLEVPFPSILADTWITTPASTTGRSGADLPGDGTTTFGDTVDSGPQTDFMFAQLTVPPGTFFFFSGRISIAANGGTTVFDQPFNLLTSLEQWWPEPASGALAAMAMLPLCIAHRHKKAKS